MEKLKTIGKFGHRVILGEGEVYPTGPIVEIFAVPALGEPVSISPHLVTRREVDDFFDKLLQSIEPLRDAAKAALTAAHLRIRSQP